MAILLGTRRRERGLHCQKFVVVIFVVVVQENTRSYRGRAGLFWGTLHLMATQNLEGRTKLLITAQTMAARILRTSRHRRRRSSWYHGRSTGRGLGRWRIGGALLVRIARLSSSAARGRCCSGRRVSLTLLSTFDTCPNEKKSKINIQSECFSPSNQHISLTPSTHHHLR